MSVTRSVTIINTGDVLKNAITEEGIFYFGGHSPKNPKMKKIDVLNLEGRSDILKGDRVPPEVKHTIVFARKQNNMDLLEDMLHDVSNPSSNNYGKYLTKIEVAELTSSPESTSYIKGYLKSNNISVIHCTVYDDYITAEATVDKLEQILHTEFYEFEHKIRPGEKFIRSMEYSLPDFLVEHVSAVFNTVQLPDHHVGKRLHLDAQTKEKVELSGVNNRISSLASNSFVTPALLNTYYNIPSNTGSQQTTQAVYAALGQTLSPSDLSYFQNYFNIPAQPISVSVGNHVSNSACATDVNNCLEANLDVQYIMATAQNVPTTYYYWTGSDVWLSWIQTVANMVNPPAVFSISYGSYEAALSSSYLNSFNTEAIKLGVMGVTLLASSGDDGVAGFLVADGSLSCGYYASFPASSPYVTAVGGTMVSSNK